MPLKRHLKILDCNTENQGLNEQVFKIAFASTDMKHVNQHFGSAKSFVIYSVYPGHSKMLEVIQFGELNHDGNEDKLMAKMNALEGCVAVYFQAIGASAVRQLKTLGIQPIKVSVGEKISKLLDVIQKELRNGSATWLMQAIKLQKPANPDRFDNMEAEGWNE